MKTNKILHTGLLILVTAAIFLLLRKTYAIDFHSLWSLSPHYLLLAVLVTLPFPLLSTLRWYYVLKGMGINIPFSRALRLIMGAWPLSILPGRLGDFAKIFAVPATKELVIGSIIFEKVVDILVLAIFSILGLLWLGNAEWALYLTIATLLLIILIASAHNFSALVPLKFKTKLTDLYAVSARLIANKKTLLKVVGASAANWGLSFLQVYFLFLATGATVGLLAILAYLPLGIFIGLLPITIAGMGTRDSAIISLFAGLATAQQSLAVGIWYSLLGYWLFALVGLPFISSLFPTYPKE